MLKTPELSMPRTRKVTTVCNGRREVWTDYEEAKAYFLELMMSAEGEERDRAECVYTQLMHGLNKCLMRMNKQERVAEMVAHSFAIFWNHHQLYLQQIDIL